MFIERPPADEISHEWLAYIDRTLRTIELAIGSTNGVAIRDQVPERPREGLIYYLREDLDDVAVEGYYVWVNNEWKRVVLEDV